MIHAQIRDAESHFRELIAFYTFVENGREVQVTTSRNSLKIHSRALVHTANWAGANIDLPYLTGVIRVYLNPDTELKTRVDQWTSQHGF